MDRENEPHRLRTRWPTGGAHPDDHLRNFYVGWLDVAPADVERYQAVLDTATDERPLQRHLTKEPKLLAQILDGGHGRWVLPHKDLGGRFEPDFVIGHKWSGPTWEWILVELQTPVLKGLRNRTGRLFLQNGRMSEQLDEGLRQINEWRRWIAANPDTAKRPRAEMGLGLTNIEPNPRGILLIGREEDLTQGDAAVRKQLGDQHNVRIHSYDWLSREAWMRLRELGRIPSDDPSHRRIPASSLFVDPSEDQ